MNEPISDFFRVSHKILECVAFKELPENAKLLYIYLCKYRNRYQRKKSYFTRSDSMLAEDTGMTRNTIRTQRKRLVRDRFIFIKAGQGKRTKYQILEPDIEIMKARKKVNKFHRHLTLVKSFKNIEN